MNKSVLFISAYEICYNPRLVKAADSLSGKGWEVEVLTPVTGIASEEVLDDFLGKRPSWNVKKVDISKRTLLSWFRWFYVSLLHFFYKRKADSLKEGKAKFFLLNKALYASSFNSLDKYDVVYINLVNNLPFAGYLKKKGKAGVIVYDSQEFFTGQYANSPGFEKDWVNWAEKNYIEKADLVCGTTGVMCRHLEKKYSIKNTIRLRNLPYKRYKGEVNKDYQQVRLIWHGLSVFYESRGVNILVEAVAKAKSPIQLTLQGNVNTEQEELIKRKLKEFGIEDFVVLKPAAPPDEILSSLRGYHIGVIGELPLEENQKLTSSNKLFDYIQSGLAVVSSNMPGIIETIEEYDVGEVYEAGDSAALARRLDNLYENKSKLEQYRENSLAAAKELIWKTDFDKIEEVLNKKV